MPRAPETVPFTLPLGRLSTTDDERVATVYRILVEDDARSRSELIARGLEPGQVDAALGTLHWRELIDASDAEHLTVAPPELTVSAYAAALEHMARSARLTVHDLAARYHRARGTLGAVASGVVQPLEGPEEVDQVVLRLESSIRSSLLVLVAGEQRIGKVADGTHRVVPAVNDNAEPVERRAVVESSSLGAPGVYEELRRRQALGYDIRLATGLPFNLLVADRTMAVIDTTNTRADAAGSLFIRDPVLITALVELMERLHATGMPLPVNDAATVGPLETRDRLILTLLASGATDASIARQIRASQRTVERRIKALMERLGVTTRFQAGVQAARMGLF